MLINKCIRTIGAKYDRRTHMRAYIPMIDNGDIINGNPIANGRQDELIDTHARAHVPPRTRAHDYPRAHLQKNKVLKQPTIRQAKFKKPHR